MGDNAEKVKPYDNTQEGKTGQVQQMFDSIAPAYDFMNRAMTFGIDRLWRKRAVKKLLKYKHEHILDVASGTGDLAVMLYNYCAPTTIIGVDLSENMLQIAREKVLAKGISENVSFEQGDCLNMRYEQGSFDIVTVAYGVRNFENLKSGYAEIFRVLKPGGVACIIELSTPTNPIVKVGYNLYANIIIPTIGRMISRDKRAYKYLPESIAAVSQGEQMLDIMRSVGFRDCKFYPLTFGTCTIYMGVKS